MPDRDDLREAADELDAARENAAADSEVADQLETYARQLRTMADAEGGPDPGRLNRMMHNLRQAEADLDGKAVAAVGSALSHVRAYRETAEGV